MTSKISFSLRIITGLLFLIAGLTKISDPIAYVQAIWAFKLIPDTLARFLAVFFPWLEFFLGIFMITGVFYQTCAKVMITLLVLFSFAIYSVIFRGMEIDCGCLAFFAEILDLPNTTDYKTILRNFILIAALVFVIYFKHDFLRMENYFDYINQEKN